MGERTHVLLRHPGQLQRLKGRTYYYGILGSFKDLDMKALEKLGPVTRLTTEDIFGY